VHSRRFKLELHSTQSSIKQTVCIATTSCTVRHTAHRSLLHRGDAVPLPPDKLHASNNTIIPAAQHNKVTEVELENNAYSPTAPIGPSLALLRAAPIRVSAPGAAIWVGGILVLPVCS